MSDFDRKKKAHRKQQDNNPQRSRDNDDDSRASNGIIQRNHQNSGHPRFQLPPDFDNDDGRYELWTVRVPQEISLQDLHGFTLTLDRREAKPDAPPSLTKRTATNNQTGDDDDDDDDDTGRSSTAKTKIKEVSDEIFTSHGGNEYSFQWGDAEEFKTLRLLVGGMEVGDDSDKDDDSEPGDEEKNENQFLFPVGRPFARHLDVIPTMEGPTETAWASRGSTPVVPTTSERKKAEDVVAADASLSRRAYGPVPSKTNIKRRWKLPGSASIDARAVAAAAAGGENPSMAEKNNEAATATLKPPPGGEQPSSSTAGLRSALEEGRSDPTGVVDDEAAAKKAAKKARKKEKKEKKRRKAEQKEAKKKRKREKRG